MPIKYSELGQDTNFLSEKGAESIILPHMWISSKFLWQSFVNHACESEA